jgi:perosamine synthetase
MSEQKKQNSMNEFPLMEEGSDNIVLFHPNVSDRARQYVNETLQTRWIGQGPNVEKFENIFAAKFGFGRSAIAVGSGTDALHLAYMLNGLKAGDEVIAPVFTCTATNLPLLYMGVKIRFADIEKDTLNISCESVERLINEKTKAIVCVHYGGLPCDLTGLSKLSNTYNIPVIEDAAQALGAKYDGKPIGSISNYTVFSFQAVKHITTGDGGMLMIQNDNLNIDKAKRLRWFGIDRSAKQMGVWENDIKEIGYKYQMNDIAAAMGLAGLEDFDDVLNHRQILLSKYIKNLEGSPDITVIGNKKSGLENAAWLCTVLVSDRTNLIKKLRSHRIESAQVHYRNDKYTVFNDSSIYPNMDQIEPKYLVLPLHPRMDTGDVDRICEVIKGGW